MKVLTIEELKYKFPKSIEKVKEFLKDLFKEEEDPENVSELVLLQLKSTDRILYDFFDSQDILLYMSKVYSWMGLHYSVCNVNEKSFTNRKEAENYMFIIAFTQLEISLEE